MRRSWYERHPDAVRRLDRPVVSVGNLVVGGSGKTPVVEFVARLLVEHGHRAAILTRGYARRRPREGVVVVGDGERVIASVDESGDEPQMLARRLPGVPVLVSADRYLAGCLAERRFGCTVHVLDDGFQHLQLARGTDLLIVDPRDLDAQVLPAGPLREPADAGRTADAVLVPGSTSEAQRVVARLGVGVAFTLAWRYGSLNALDGRRSMPAPGNGTRVLAIAGIARPERFFSALRALGWNVVHEMAFPDHHWYTTRDFDGIQRTAERAQADIVVTTEKDAVRVGAHAGWAALPMDVDIEPRAAFADWLLRRFEAPVAGRALSDPPTTS